MAADMTGKDKRVKIVILTCVYKRPQILKLFLENFQALRKDLIETIDLTMIMAGAVWDDYAVWKTYDQYKEGILWVEMSNKQLGRKWNATSKYLRHKDFDYVLILGSDDLINKTLLTKYIDHAKAGYNYFGLKDMFVLNSKTGEMIYWKGYTHNRKGETIGAGRMLSKRIVEELDYTLWDDKLNRGLDGSMTSRIKKLPFVNEKVFSYQKDSVLVCDVKSDVNIWSFRVWKGNTMNAGEVIRYAFAPSVGKCIFDLVPMSYAKL